MSQQWELRPAERVGPMDEAVEEILRSIKQRSSAPGGDGEHDSVPAEAALDVIDLGRIFLC